MSMKGVGSDYLWEQIAAMLTELSTRDEVLYRVMATPESVEAKMDAINQKMAEHLDTGTSHLQ
jgi:hypothetical protein|tara:strand:- start:324 stop:512 length:189 start_codon:yes stop_codon:yes gene_type:complete